MAKTNETHNLNSVFVFVLVIFSAIVSSSSARQLKINGVLPLSQAAATEPALNLALPTDKVVVDAASFQKSKNVFPCDDHMGDNSGKISEAEIPVRLAGKYGPSAILNMLPKGQFGNSGPSRGTNDIKN